VSGPIRVLVIQPGSMEAETRTIRPELEEFQSLVGGNIEALNLTDKIGACINEDGKRLNLPRNVAGEALIRRGLESTGRMLSPGDWIVGPVVIVGVPLDRSVTDEAIELARSVGIKVED